MALSRRRDRNDVRALGGARGRELRHVSRRPVLPPIRSARTRSTARRSPGSSWRRSPARSRSPTAIRWSACRSASPCCAASATRSRRGPTCSARRDGPGHLVDRDPRRRPRTIAAPAILALVLDALSGIWPSGLMVDGVALGDAVAPSGDPHAGPLGPDRAVPQALAVAHLLADRADRAGRRDGDRRRRPHRPARVSQRRPADRHGRDRAARTARPGDRRTRSRPS